MAGGASGSSALDYTAKNLPPLEIGEGGRNEVDGAESAGNPFAYRAPPTATPNLTPPPTADSAADPAATADPDAANRIWRRRPTQTAAATLRP